MLSLCSLIVVMFVVGRISRRIGMEAAIADAKRAVHIVGTSLIEPALTSDRMTRLRSNDAAVRKVAIAEMHVISDHARRSGGFVRIKLWNTDGSLLYADDDRLLSSDVRLDHDAMDVLLNGGIEAEATSLDKTENQFERAEGRLLEVYLSIADTSGDHLLFEGYLPYSRVITSGRRVWLDFAPGVLLGLTALTGIGTLLVASVARRLRRANAQRELLLHHAIVASDAERRLVAADLHDGVVQDLTGLSLTLATTRMRASKSIDSSKVGYIEPSSDVSAMSAALEDAERQLREVVHALRSLIVEIYPPNLRDEGLAAAIRSLCARLHNRGITTDLRIEGDDHAIEDADAALAYRVVQEALRNVVAHAEARHVGVCIRRTDVAVTITVEDDGFGFDPQIVQQRASVGHVGLRGLGDLVSEQGGTLRLRTGPDQGTQVVLHLPATEWNMVAR